MREASDDELEILSDSLSLASSYYDDQDTMSPTFGSKNYYNRKQSYRGLVTFESAKKMYGHPHSIVYSNGQQPAFRTEKSRDMSENESQGGSQCDVFQ